MQKYDGRLDWQIWDMIRPAMCKQLARVVQQLLLYVSLGITFSSWGQEISNLILFSRFLHQILLLQCQWKQFWRLLKHFCRNCWCWLDFFHWLLLQVSGYVEVLLWARNKGDLVGWMFSYSWLFPNGFDCLNNSLSSLWLKQPAQSST